MQILKDLCFHAYKSPKTSVFGGGAGILLIYRGIDQHDWFCIVGGFLVALCGLCARDADKSSEDHGVDGVSQITKFLVLAMLFTPIAARAEFEVIKADKPDAVGHVDIKPNSVHVESGALQGTVTHNAEIHPGAIPITLRVSEKAFQASASTTAPIIEAPITTTPKTFNVEAPITFEAPNVAPNAIHLEIHIPENAVVIHAENTAKPLDEIKSAVLAGAGRVETYLCYALIGVGLFALIMTIAWFVTHRHRMQLLQEKTQ